MPEILAKSVSSLPMPTLTPGLKRVPRCRTRIDPPVTNSPAKRFTPSRCELLSRPFRELPTPFLWAMAITPYSASGQRLAVLGPVPRLNGNFIDSNRSEILPVTVRAAILLLPLLLENQNLLGSITLHDCGLN